jgi:hypothetical protein
MRLVSLFVLVFVPNVTYGDPPKKPIIIKDGTNWRKIYRGRCIQPPQLQSRDEFCPIPFVPERICHSSATMECGQQQQGRPTIAGTGGGGVDVCNVVAHALLADFEIFHVVLLHSAMCQDEIRSGDFTRQDVERVLPYNDELVGIVLNGSDLLAAIEHGLDVFHTQHVKEAYPIVAGIRFHLDLKEPYGRRVAQPEVFDDKCRWQPLRPTAEYDVLVPASLANGGSYDYAALTRAKTRASSNIGLTDAFWFYAQGVCIVRDPFRVTHHPPTKQRWRQTPNFHLTSNPAAALTKSSSYGTKVNKTAASATM